MTEIGFLPIAVGKFHPRGGVNTMARNDLKKVGDVSFRPVGAGKVQFQWRDPQSGCYVRRRESATMEQAAKMAVQIGASLLVGKGFHVGNKRKPTTPLIKDAIADAIKLGGGNAETKADLGRKGALFVRWIEERHPRVKVWGDLKPLHVRAYVRELEEEGLAPDSIRLRLVPVKSAWKYATENFDEVKPLPKIKLPAPPSEKVVNFEAVEVATLLQFLQKKDATLAGIATLMALAGLREQEAAALRCGDVDLVNGVIRITKTAAHTPKNKSSYREIPICREALQVLVEAFDRQKVIVLGEQDDRILFPAKKGGPYSANWLSRQLGDLLSQCAKETGMQVFHEVYTRKLRSSFITMAKRLGADPEALRRYVGHSAKGVMERHYLGHSEGDLRGIAQLMDNWRSLISEGQDCKKIATPGKVR